MKINIKVFRIALGVALAVCVLTLTLVTAFHAGTRSEIITEIPRTAAQKEQFTVLVAGCDRVSGLTDVMMLVSAKKDGGISVLQIPRDTYAAYTEKNYKKINGAYGQLGGEGLKGFISQSFGVEIDRYMVLSPDAFCSVVDALGGIEVEVTKTLYYNDPAQELYIYITKGRHLLDGSLAEQLVRYRAGYADGDLGRMDTQKAVMYALMQRLLDSSDGEIPYKLFDALVGKVDTDMTMSDIGQLFDAAKNTKKESIFFVTAPGRAITAKKSGASYYVLSAPAMEELRYRLFAKQTGEFDYEGVFSNSTNKEFLKIYSEYSDYTVYSAEDIAKGGAGVIDY